jgi:hypothetical protein
MPKITIEELARQIIDLDEKEKRELAKQVLPVLIGVEVKKRTMEALSDEQLDAVITQLRERNKELSEEEVAQVIRQALEEVRAAGCT